MNEWSDGWPSIGRPFSRHVGVWYITLFYSAGFGNVHWDAVRRRGGALPMNGPESSEDPAVMERQYRQMRQCGIDFLVMDDTNCVYVDDRRIDALIRTWFDFMEAKPPARRIPIAIAAGGELNQHNKRDAWLEAVDYLWRTFARRPAYLRVQGRPVLHWYVEQDVWPEWSDPRWTIRRTHHFLWSARQVRDGGWGYGSDPNLPAHPVCSSFFPGWDLSPPGFPREGGDLYRRLWMKAIRRGSRHVLLSDWNGWAEGAALEDSDSWRDSTGASMPCLYRLLTQGYAAAYKGVLVNGFLYRDERNPTVWRWNGRRLLRQTADSDDHPVIVLPAGHLDLLTAHANRRSGW